MHNQRRERAPHPPLQMTARYTTPCSVCVVQRFTHCLHTHSLLDLESNTYIRNVILLISMLKRQSYSPSITYSASKIRQLLWELSADDYYQHVQRIMESSRIDEKHGYRTTTPEIARQRHSLTTLKGDWYC